MMPSLNTTPPFLKNRIRRYEVNGYAFDMVWVEKGKFRMGGEDGEAHDNEKPVLWQKVGFEGKERPVESVSWEDICGSGGFLEKLNAAVSESGDGGFALPTEAQWEYAARGGWYGEQAGYIYAGSSRLEEVGWYDGNSGAETYAVGQKQSNLLGLYDMSGNVFEWCSDLYGDYPSDTRNNPKGPTEGAGRVYRGGGGFNNARSCRVSHRGSLHPRGHSLNIGFRLARNSKPL